MTLCTLLNKSTSSSNRNSNDGNNNNNNYKNKQRQPQQRQQQSSFATHVYMISLLYVLEHSFARASVNTRIERVLFLRCISVFGASRAAHCFYFSFASCPLFGGLVYGHCLCIAHTHTQSVSLFVALGVFRSILAILWHILDMHACMSMYVRAYFHRAYDVSIYACICICLCVCVCVFVLVCNSSSFLFFNIVCNTNESGSPLKWNDMKRTKTAISK